VEEDGRLFFFLDMDFLYFSVKCIHRNLKGINVSHSLDVT